MHLFHPLKVELKKEIVVQIPFAHYMHLETPAFCLFIINFTYISVKILTINILFINL